MSAEIPTIEPAELVAGDSWTWQRALSDYPAGTWVLTYYLRGQAGEASFAAAASGTDHLVSVSAATTAAYKAGLYRWTAVVTSGSERYTVGSGSLTVKPDPSKTGAGFDARSHARRTLEAIEAVIEGKATSDQMEYTIGSRSLKRIPVKDLLEFRDKYRAQVFAEDSGERARKGQNTGRLVAKL